jgi:hypothetical protein
VNEPHEIRDPAPEVQHILAAIYAGYPALTRDDRLRGRDQNRIAERSERHGRVLPDRLPGPTGRFAARNVHSSRVVLRVLGCVKKA